jgi:hypothetical protein
MREDGCVSVSYAETIQGANGFPVKPMFGGDPHLRQASISLKKNRLDLRSGRFQVRGYLSVSYRTEQPPLPQKVLRTTIKFGRK